MNCHRKNNRNVRNQNARFQVFVMYLITFVVSNAVQMGQNESSSLVNPNISRGSIPPVSSLSFQQKTSPQNESCTDRDGGSQGVTNSRGFDGKTTQDINRTSELVENPLQSFSNNVSMMSNLDKENDSSDSAKISNERSAFFKKVTNAIYFWFLGNYHSLLLCGTDCKASSRALCSCSQSCVSLGTCCLDFRDMCSNGIEKAPVNIKVLEHASTECINGRHVITSCPENGLLFSEHSKNSLPEADHSEPGGVPVKKEIILQRENKTHQYNKTTLKTEPMTILDLLKLMAYNSTVALHTLNNVISDIVSKTPITDLESGLSFRNISVFSCNGANLDRSQLWDVDMLLKKGVVLPSSKFPSLEKMLALLNYPMKYSAYRFKVKGLFFNGNHKCSADSITSCPDKYHDEDITSACRNIYLPVTVYDVQGAPTYKNPFCLVCNEGVRDFKLVSQILSWEYDIFLRFEGSSPNVSVNRRVHLPNKQPAWASLTCQLQTKQPEREINNLARELQNRTGQCGLGSTGNVSECRFPESDNSLKEKASLSSLCCPTNVSEQNKTEDYDDSSSSDFNRQHGSDLETLNHSGNNENRNKIKTGMRDQLPGMGERESLAKQQEPVDVATCIVSRCPFSTMETTGICSTYITAFLALPPPSVPLSEDDVYRHFLSYRTFLTKILTTLRSSNEDEDVVEFENKVYEQRNYVYTFKMEFFSDVYHTRFTRDEKEKIADFFLNGSYPFRDEFRYVCANVIAHRRGKVQCNEPMVLYIPKTSSQEEPSSSSLGNHDERNHLLVTVVWVAVIRVIL